MSTTGCARSKSSSAGGELGRVGAGAARAAVTSAKRVLVVDDSLTVRELERKLLASRGYDVTIAVDGMDGWNAVRGERFDLVITDIDMPRIDGIELVTLIKRDAQLCGAAGDDRVVQGSRGRPPARPRCGRGLLPRERQFPRQALLDAVRDLIGEARKSMKIGIVNDVPLAVEALRRALAARPDFEIAWVAHDGQQAVDFCAAQHARRRADGSRDAERRWRRGDAPHHGARAVRDPRRHRRCRRERVARV